MKRHRASAEAVAPPADRASRPQHGVGALLRQPLDDVTAGLDAQVAQAARRARALVVMLAAAVATWWIYVPVHELLHALGCWITGGTVTELQVAPEYGGALLARVVPFVVSGGDYAGRLSGFDTHGSDLVYLATDAMPFLLSVFIGVPLLKVSGLRPASFGRVRSPLGRCGRLETKLDSGTTSSSYKVPSQPGTRPAVLGAACTVALAPFYSITGDYYEMGSILTTRAVTVLTGSGASPAFASLRSDDVVRLIGDLWAHPEQLQLHTPAAVAGGAVLIGIALVVGIALAYATYGLGSWFAARVYQG
jgi:hypothetical protein